MVRSRRRSGHSALRQTPVDAHEHMRDSLTEAAFLLLLQGTRGSRYRWRPTAMLLLMFSHGLRVSALCNLKDKDLALAHGRRWIARLTGSLSTTRPLCTEEWRALKRSLPQRGEVQLPWLSLTERGDQCTPFALTYLVRVTSERAGVGWHVHPHMLRQGCGYALAKRGDDLRVIHDDLGHRAPTHTTRSTPTAAHRFEGLWEEASGDCPVPQHAMPAEAVRDLRRRLAPLPPRSPERRRLRHETARRYGSRTRRATACCASRANHAP
jgi:type 1 fimbriae regulatory protein FimB